MNIINNGPRNYRGVLAISDLVSALKTHTLSPEMEDVYMSYGHDKMEHHINPCATVDCGIVHLIGRFEDIDYVFNIFGTIGEMKPVIAAINENRWTDKYREALKAFYKRQIVYAGTDAWAKAEADGYEVNPEGNEINVFG